MKVLSLFDGISCGRVACDRAGIPVEAYYASEIDKYAMLISQNNWPDILQMGSVVDIDTRCFMDGIDLLIGGSPCQDLSIAKKGREGLSGARSGLFYEYLRILKEVKPKYFVLENVNSMPKEAKQTITEELFGIEPIMINAALVSAQNRKRLFWVGKLVGDTYEQVKIELPEDRGILLRDILEPKVDESYTVKDKSNTIRTSGRGSGVDDKHNWDSIRIGEFNKGGQGDRIYSPEGKSVTLSANGGGRGAKTGLYLINNKETYGKLDDGTLESEKGLQKSEGYLLDMQSGEKNGDTSYRRGLAQQQSGEFTGSLSGMSYQNTSQKTDVQSRGMQSDTQTKRLLRETQPKVQKDRESINECERTSIRKLTCIECERLQSLPDNYTEGVSNTQRYKALGNAFNVDVIAHILKQLV